MNQIQNRTSLILGGVLIAAGLLALAGQGLDLWIGGASWPLVVVGAGAAFFVGMLLGGSATAGLAIPGSILTMVGLILFAQNLFGRWETWSYVWTLLVSAIGLGLVVQGAWSGRPDLSRRGWHVAQTGLWLFLFFGVFTELFFSFAGISNSGWVFWAALLALLGAALLVVRVYTLLRDPQAERVHLFGPILLTGVGVLLVLTGLGYLPAWNLFALVGLWPLLLIVAGARLIFGRRSPWIDAGLGILAVVGIFLLSFTGGMATRSFSMFVPGMVVSGSQPVHTSLLGSTTLRQESRPLSGIDRVRLEGIGTLEIVQGNDEGLLVEAEDNLLAHLTSRVSGSQLTLGIEPGVRLLPRRLIHYRLTVKDLREVQVTAAGEVDIQNLSAGDLRLDVSGAGNLNLEGLQASSLEVNFSGAGLLRAAGEVESLQVDISGFGSFDGAGLRSQEARVQISGFGQASLGPTDNLRTDVSGLGAVTYSGSPRLLRNDGGLSIIRRMEK